jgi:microsomal prostaglandin-E synthase 2
MHRCSRVASSVWIRSKDCKSVKPASWTTFRSPVSTLNGGLVLGATLAFAGVSIPIVCESESNIPPVVTELPGDIDLSKCQVTVYQFESCPFCRKARAVLDLARVPYNVVEVNPLTKSETKSFASDYKKVPIVIVDDGKRSFQIRDSKIIIKSILKAGKVPIGDSSRTGLPDSASLNAETVLDTKVYEGMTIEDAWIKWVESYLLQLVVVNIYGTLDESRETFDYLLTHRDFGWFMRSASYWLGSIVMHQVARSRLKKFTDIQGKHKQVFFDACADLGRKAGTAGGFIGGTKPNAADLNAYGVIRSLEGTRTLRDAIAGGAGEEFKVWYERMNKTVGDSGMKAKVNATKRGSA